ncbi:MAG: bi-domain-containing oxidoreductase [Proteobacteria bacterium]|nr:bi-domain-containing oxidoreductase [Pseudomonadota bacterium]
MKQIAQNYKTGVTDIVEVPVPACLPGGVLVRTLYSAVSVGTEMMKMAESKMSLLGKARARPDKVKQVLRSVRQQGILPTVRKVRELLDSYTPLGYSLVGEVAEVGDGVSEFEKGQIVACAGNKYALHAEYNWVPTNLCVHVPDNIDLRQASFTTIASVALHGFHQSDLKLGEQAIVVGLGLIGQMLVRILASAGVDAVGLDPSEERCRLAEKGGAFMATTPDGEGLEVLRRAVAQRWSAGADVVFLAAATNSGGPIEIASEFLRDRGRVVDIGKCRMDLPWNAFSQKELDVRFSRSYGPGRYDVNYEEKGIDYPIGYVRWTERRNMQSIVHMMAAGRLDLSDMIDQRFPFSEAAEVLERMDRGELTAVGVVFEYSGDAPMERRIESPSRPRSAAVSRAGEAVRFGVIGAGNYAKTMLLPHLKRDSRARLVEVVTNTALSGRNAVHRFGFEKMSTDVEPLLADENIDAVIIATRHDSHVDLVCRALEAGKAVFVEKPLALDLGQLDRIRKSVDRTGNDRLMVGFNRRFSPMLQKMKALWGERKGPHVIHYRVNAGRLAGDTWYGDEKNQGSRFIGEGGHFIDVACWWLGQTPEAVHALAVGGDGESIQATLTFPDGSLAVIGYLTTGAEGSPKEYIEVIGDNATARLENFRRLEYWAGSGRKSHRSMGANKGQKEQLSAFVGAVANGGPMPIDLETLFAVTKATIEIAHPDSS